MVIYGRLVRLSSLLLNLMCSWIVPVVESVAYRVRIGGGCECPSPQNSSPAAGRRKHKRHKNSASGVGGGGVSHHHNFNHDVKRIKLLLDITVAKNGSQVLDIQASTARGSEDAYNTKAQQQQQCKKNPGLILTALNLPSSVMLWFVNKVRQLAYDLEEHPSCDDPNRIKKSPKRRITRANYRKIIPFFPFNLLGFSNYSAFQMPSITRSSSSTTGNTDDANNLNVSSASVNGKARCKRRRNSSTDDSSCSSLSDDDISYLELPEKTIIGTFPPNAAAGGHDEVDSDETADTIANRVTSSSSSSDNNKALLHKNLRSSSTKDNDSKKISVTLNTSTSEDNGGGNLTTMTDLDSSNNDVVGEEHQVRFTFIEELNEAANESYNSIDDPDYVPPEHHSSTSDSSFATDKGCSEDESFLVATAVTYDNDATDEVKKEMCNVSLKETPVEKPKEDDKPKTNGTSSNSKAVTITTTPTASAPVATTTAPNSGNKKKQKNKKQNGTPNNRKSVSSTPPHPNSLEPLSTGNEDDYKTPEEGEHAGHPF